MKWIPGPKGLGFFIGYSQNILGMKLFLQLVGDVFPQ